MGAARFYHLTRSAVEAALPMLVGKSLEAGWRVAIRGTEAARMRWLDEKLWLGPEEGFLPHGLAGGPHDADQPVLLTTAPEAPNGAACVMAIDGADVTAEEVAALERVCILFDGNDPDALGRARAQWKALTEAGASAQYWSEEDGPWRMKAER
ncbi:DNA polymerase III subunit chi [Defluviimonas sp. 20V17]|uniref:DNA polymerase III subunit chi n=1 Tax=Allgaiera indica TaxID=765699 RepID=A0AAN4UU73_9RHOB|nr:DNA polymerase III subunit chi [Allgaiera indica]KDB05192.1 DNA polymerase III subunit chi [Defluviimonas sp. 20V17]GHE05304.1 DNA polymerase III subunit chi [Allgaiera indica]SDX62959.1 DNA polymerase III, chi subunit [Allgaiera indica]